MMPLLYTAVLLPVIYKLLVVLINYNKKLFTCIFSKFQGAAGMLGSADLVKLSFLEIMNEIFVFVRNIISDFYVVI